MGQYERHVFVCTVGDNYPTQPHILNGVPVKRLIYDPGVKGAHKVT